MRAKLIGVILVAVVAVSFAVTCTLIVGHAVGQMEKLSLEARDLADRDLRDEAVAKMAQLASEWKRHQPFLETLISHDETEAVVERYTMAQISLRQDEMNGFYTALALLGKTLNHIRDQETVRWGNIL